MDNREKLIELLRDVRSCSSVLDTTGDIADRLIAHGVVVREDGCEVCRRHVPPGANYCWKCGRPLR